MATYRERRPLKHLNVPQTLGFGEGGSTIPNLYDYFLQVDDYIDELKNQSGAGDMTKAVYDKNGNGKVDEAENVAWENVSGKPSSYPPETHSHATGVTQIADPATATTEDIANKINELIAALQG